jgi:hypothetical protein
MEEFQDNRKRNGYFETEEALGKILDTGTK